MLSQTAVLPEVHTIHAAPQAAVHIAISVLTKPLAFEVHTPPKDGVRVDPKDSSILIVSPGRYFLDFTVLDDTFLNPAIILSTPFGPLPIPPTGETTATLSDINTLTVGDGEQLYPFTFRFSSGPVDPTIVNTPDPA